MSAPQGAGRSVEIRLVGYVTLQDVCAHVGDIWRAARQQQGVLFAIDCAAVIDFSTLALTALGRLRKHLREFGCELVLVRCSPSVLERKDDPLLAPLLTAQVPVPVEAEAVEVLSTAQARNRLRKPEKPTKLLRKDDKHSDQAPYHVRLLVRDFQRYWLN
jgi:hypothetical protein